MSWRLQLRSLPFKTKIAITVIGAGIAVLGLSTYLSFEYWQKEARAVAEQQALLAAVSTRASIELSLNRGNEAAAQRTLQQLLHNPAVRAARVYDAAGVVILSATSEEVGQRIGRVWIPSAGELPRDGVARTVAGDREHAVHAFAPVGSSLQNVLEIEFSIAVVEKAMQRGARLGVGLLIASLFALALILYAALQREVDKLQAKGATAEQLAEHRRRMLEEKAGFAEVGELAAEMAHEFKRPLASIQTAIQLLEQEYTLGEDEQRLLTGIQGQLERLSETMRDVFGLAKPISVEREEVDLHDVLNNALFQVASTGAASAVNIRREYSTELPRVRADARRLEQAFINVMSNAIEAMPTGGVLTVRATPRADQIAVEFIDSGCGMDDVQKVMKPFYSTKATGTGLGLPLVARIMAAHDGLLQIESEKGAGTTVRLLLPMEQMQNQEGTWAQQESSSSTTTISSAR